MTPVPLKSLQISITHLHAVVVNDTFPLPFHTLADEETLVVASFEPLDDK